MPRPSTHIVSSTGGQQQMPDPEEAPFSHREDNEYGMTSTYPPTISSTSFSLPQPAAEQHGPMAHGYGHEVHPSTGDLDCADALNSIQHHGLTSPGISGVNEMALQTNQSLLSAANPGLGFSHFDYDGDAIMDLTPIPDSALDNMNARNSLYGTAWHELGNNSISLMQEIYNLPYSSDVLTSQFLPQTQGEVVWENDPSFQTASLPRMWPDQAERDSFQHAEYDNWPPNTFSMPYPSNAMMHPATETSPHASPPAYVESRQDLPQFTSPSSQSNDRNGTGAMVKDISMQ